MATRRLADTAIQSLMARGVYPSQILALSLGLVALVVALSLHLFGPIEGRYAPLAPIEIVWGDLQASGRWLIILLAVFAGFGVSGNQTTNVGVRGLVKGASIALNTCLAATGEEPKIVWRRIALITIGFAVAILLGLPLPHQLYDLAALWVLIILLFAQPAKVALDTAKWVLIGIAAFLAISYAYTIIKAHVFYVRSPLDNQLVAIEQGLLGAHPHRWFAALAASSPSIAIVFNEAYLAFFPHMVMVAMFLYGASHRRELSGYGAALGICYAIGAPAYFLFPALGPAFTEPENFAFLGRLYLWLHQVQDHIAAMTQKALTGDFRYDSLQPYAFVACMPSLHLAHETVMLFYSRRSHVVLSISAGFFVLTAFATMGTGMHYAIDLPFGIGLGMASIYLVRYVERRAVPRPKE